MDPEKLGQVLAAIELLADEAGGLEKKPNVADVEAQVGFDITAAERDEAWGAYQKKQEAVQDAADDLPDADDKVAMVTNHYTSPIFMAGVTVLPGATMPVPGYRANDQVMTAWVDAGVISVA